MASFYTNERNHQILIALLKEHNIRTIVASPGIANSVFVGSIQHDPFFTLYSVVDERSAAYMACGIAAESGEPVVISCTGATAARNYMPGMTEAYYSKLPILCITSSQPNCRIGHLQPQVTYRLLGEDVNPYVAAAGHFGNKSPHLVKDYVENLGFQYLSASTKEELKEVLSAFTTPAPTPSPMLLEVFVEDHMEREALDIIHNRH